MNRRMADRGGVIGWLMSPARRIWVGVLYLFIVLLFLLMGLSLSKQIRDERTSCEIQSFGVPAQHHLSRAMVDIRNLLLVRPTPEQKRAQGTPRPELLRIVTDLKTELGAYVALTAEQPAGRRC